MPGKRKKIPEGGRPAKKAKQSDDPDDQIPRKDIKIEELDLQSKKYVMEWQQADIEVDRPPRQRWVHNGPQPMEDKDKLPKGWMTDEPDLDPDDLDAQIQRCKDRLEDKIMPHVFEIKLENFQRRKEEQDKLKEGEPLNLGLDVYERINALEMIRYSFEEGKYDDTYEQLPNVKSLLAAYRSKDLTWLPGLVTYWSKGKRLCEPRPLDWDEFEALSRASNGEKGFWVEGMSGPGPMGLNMAMKISPPLRRPGVPSPTLKYRIALRLPTCNWWQEFDFLYDTGASSMGINEADLRALTGVNQEPTIPILSNNTFRVASGAILNRPMVLVEACILDENRRRLTAWTRVPTVINGPGAVDRLDGPVLRSLLYTATQPDGAMELFVSTTKTIAGMKTVNMQTNPPIMPMFSFPPAPGAVLGNYTYQGGGTGTFNPNQAAPKVFPRRAGRAPL